MVIQHIQLDESSSLLDTSVFSKSICRCHSTPTESKRRTEVLLQQKLLYRSLQIFPGASIQPFKRRCRGRSIAFPEGSVSTSNLNDHQHRPSSTTTSSISGRDEQMAKTDMAVASAATLVDAQCMAAEVIRAERVFGLCFQCHHQCSFYRRYLTLTVGVATSLVASKICIFVILGFLKD
ncbi:unnamed protein product [Brassica rapa subsp. trilocularis]